MPDTRSDNFRGLGESFPGQGSAVLAFVTDERSETTLRAGLADSAGSIIIKRGDARAAIRHLEREPSPGVIIIDVSGISDPLVALQDLARVCMPSTDVLIIGERSDFNFYRNVVKDLGADEYLAKPLTREDVATTFGPIVKGVGSSEDLRRGGRLVALVGARGGVGTTTLAVNLALDVAEKTGGHVALLDLHLQNGAAAAMLGVRPGAGLRVALEDPEKADTLFIDRASVPFGDRVRVIACDEPLDQDVKASRAAVARLLDLLRQRFNHVVIDLPSPPGDLGRMVLQIARQRVLVLTPDVVALNGARAMRDLIELRMGLPAPLLVLNRANERGALTRKLVQEGLGTGPDVSLPDLRKPIGDAANLGEPAIKSSSAFRRALSPLTLEISGAGTGRDRSLLARLFGRKG